MGVGSCSPAAWSARRLSCRRCTPSAAHFLKSHQLLVQKFAADRDRQSSSFKPERVGQLVVPFDARDGGLGHVGGAVDIRRRGCVPVTRKTAHRFSESRCDRSTILARARFQPCYCHLHEVQTASGANRPSVTIRPPIPTPVQRVTRISAETDDLAKSGSARPATASTRETGGLVHVSGRVNGGTIDTGRHTAAPIWVSESGNEKRSAPVFGNQDGIAQRSSPGHSLPTVQGGRSTSGAEAACR